jgi:hypothetical protein
MFLLVAENIKGGLDTGLESEPVQEKRHSNFNTLSHGLDRPVGFGEERESEQHSRAHQIGDVVSSQ